jgi:predicted CopG family antitoxin
MEKRTYTKVICDLCGTEYDKALSEVKRNQQLNRKSYCSRSCQGKDLITKNLPVEKRVYSHLQKGSKKDQYSGFREFLRRIKNRKKHECNLDLPYLLNLWNKQEGKCIYTNIGMVLPDGRLKGTMFTASLDRINSSLGYVKGNVQYTLTSVNFMKNNMSHEETKELIKLIVNNY